MNSMFQAGASFLCGDVPLTTVVLGHAKMYTAIHYTYAVCKVGEFSGGQN